MAGLVFIDGNLLTQDPARLHAEALAVEGDRIAAVGSRTDVERAVRPGARTVDLGGRTLVPGFNDAHAHAWKLGQLLTSVLDLRGRELMRETHAAGRRLAVHAIGDEAIERVLSAYESLGPEVPRRRHRIEHLGLPDRGHLRRAATLGIVAVSQTVFIHSLGRNFCEYLPEALLARTYPVREMMEAGIRVGLSSDAPVVEED